MKATVLPLLLLDVVLASTALAFSDPGPWANDAYYPGQLDGRYSANVYNNAGDHGTETKKDTSITITNTSTTTNSTTVIVDDNGVLTSTNTTTIVSTPVTTKTVISGAGDVVSGVIGFGIQDGGPSRNTNALSTGVTSGNIAETIALDAGYNYFVIYVNGDVFAGRTAASINPDADTVNGTLWAGVGQPSYEKVTNTIFNTNSVPIGETVTLLAVPGATSGGYFNARVNSDKAVYTFSGFGQIHTIPTAAGVSPITSPFKINGIKTANK